jgi:hypothetical protein
MFKSWEGFRIGGLLLKRLLNVIAVVEFFDETVVDKVFRLGLFALGFSCRETALLRQPPAGFQLCVHFFHERKFIHVRRRQFLSG